MERLRNKRRKLEMKKKWWILSLLMLSLMMMGSICVVHAAEEEKTYYCVIKNQNQVVLSNSPKGHVAAWITLSSAVSSKAAEGMSYTAQTDQLNITEPILHAVSPMYKLEQYTVIDFAVIPVIFN